MSGFIVTLTLFDKSEGYNEPRHYGQALIGVNASLLKSGVVSGLDHNVGVFFRGGDSIFVPHKGFLIQLPCREENLCKSGQPLNTPLVDCGKQLFR